VRISFGYNRGEMTSPRTRRRRPLEAEIYARGYSCIAGIDEAGRGPLAGPVVAAAVILPPGFRERGIKDSKLLTALQRESLEPVIKTNAISWGLGVVEVEEIDRINILQASLRAMALACEALQPAPECVLIDGNRTIPLEFFALTCNSAPSTVPRQTTIVKGDRICLSVAAASIIAKVARDQIMIQLDRAYPRYGFASHKGYACPAHLEALRRYGPSPVHRRSFAPVREMFQGRLEF
jgi:ribonuclease HII